MNTYITYLLISQVFEINLEKEGLELEYEQVETNGLHFIKIHAPKEVLRRYAEILKLRLPMKDLPGCQMPHQTSNYPIIKEVNTFFRRIMSKYYVNTTIFPTMRQKFTAVYSRDKEYLFDLNSPNFFTSARSRIVQFILDRTKFTDTKDDDFAFGIERLISEHAYVATYPLHDVSFIFNLYL